MSLRIVIEVILGVNDQEPLTDGTGRIRTGDLALQIGVSFLTLWTIPSPWACRL